MARSVPLRPHAAKKNSQGWGTGGGGPTPRGPKFNRRLLFGTGAAGGGVLVLNSLFGGNDAYTFEEYVDDLLAGEFGDVYYGKDSDGREYMIDQAGVMSVKYFDPADKPAAGAAADLSGYIVAPTGEVVKITEDAGAEGGFREDNVGSCKRTLRGNGALPLYDMQCTVSGRAYDIKIVDVANVTSTTFPGQ